MENTLEVEEYYKILKELNNNNNNNIVNFTLYFDENDKKTKIIDVFFNELSKLYIERYVRYDNFKEFVILYYSKLFDYMYNYIMDTVKENIIKCDICNKSYLISNNLDIKVYDNNNKDYLCSIDCCCSCYEELEKSNFVDDDLLYVK